MGNHPNRAGKFELTFTNYSNAPTPRYRRHHRSLDAALECAVDVIGKMRAKYAGSGEFEGALRPLVYGPGCGRGVTLPDNDGTFN